jgi:uncharacterized membrane protein (TIGR02234 family)
VRGSFRLHLVLLGAGAALVLWGSSVAWITWTQPDAISLSPVTGEATGAHLQPSMRAFGVLALAGVPALFALRRPRVRRWFGAGLALTSAVAVAVSAMDAVAYRRHPVLRDLVPDGGCVDGHRLCIDHHQGPQLGPALVLLGVLLLLLAAAVAARWGGSWRTGLGSSYEPPGAAPEPPVTDKGVWDALDRGDDPTA